MRDEWAYAQSETLGQLGSPSFLYPSSLISAMHRVPIDFVTCEAILSLSLSPPSLSHEIHFNGPPWFPSDLIGRIQIGFAPRSFPSPTTFSLLAPPPYCHSE